MTATVTFSMEIELGWGLVHYDNLAALSKGRHAETQALDQLLTLCDELHIPFSFDVVGHLLLDSPLSSYDGGHEKGWFEDIPKTGPTQDPEFYAPDLTDRIRQASVDHEICTHTLTHVECANVSRDTLRWELDNVMKTHEDHGLSRPVSIVPPRHSPPYRDVLEEYEIEIVRSPRARAPDTSEASNRLALGKDILTGAQPITPPRLVDGIVETYCTRYPSLTAPFLRSGQMDPHPVFKMIPLSVRQWLHRRNMNRALRMAVQRDSHVHFWTHLWELSNDRQWAQIEHFLSQVAIAQNRNEVQIRTMKQLNDQVRSC